MPSCRDCKYYERKFGCTLCGPLSKDTRWEQWPEHQKRLATRVCNLGVILKWLYEMSGEVLEVGYGISKHFRRGLRRNRYYEARWWGVEPVFPTKTELRAYRASAARMPMFEDEKFDWVVAFQSMEHWHEGGDSLEDGLREIRRVLKPGGRFLATVPFHIHGLRMFWNGDVDEFESVVRSQFAQVEFERWRWDHRPLAKLENWKIAWELRREEYGPGVRVPDGSGQPDGPSSWQMEVMATK